MEQNLPPVTVDQTIKIAEVYARMAQGSQNLHLSYARAYCEIADSILRKFVKVEINEQTKENQPPSIDKP